MSNSNQTIMEDTPANKRLRVDEDEKLKISSSAERVAGANAAAASLLGTFVMPETESTSSTSNVPTSNATTLLSDPKQQQLQLQQQQIRLMQMQQQQLQSMSQNDFTTMTAMAQQMALGMVMMPMMTPYMLNNQMNTTGTVNNDGKDENTFKPNTMQGDLNTTDSTTSDLSTSIPQAMMASQFLMHSQPPMNLEEMPKRKRGRPPKKDIAARARAEAERALKQFPIWGYGMPMPLFPGVPTSTAESSTPSSEDPNANTSLSTNDNLGGNNGLKKKSRGTGKPRGRPRTRPRPGEIIYRAKPLPIAPANYSTMYNYSLANLAHKSGELAQGITTTVLPTMPSQDTSTSQSIETEPQESTSSPTATSEVQTMNHVSMDSSSIPEEI